jgi:rhomboid protease GluP
MDTGREDPRHTGNGESGPVNDDEYVPDDEDFAVEPERPRGPLSIFPSPVHIIPAIVLFILFYAATAIYGVYPERDYLWISGDSIFMDHEYWRLLTAIFTHSDISHLLSNAPIFLVFGWMLKAYFGLSAFPIASIGIGLITNAITVAVYDPRIHLIGASGMAYGMVSLWLVFYIHNDTYYSLPFRIFRALGFAVIMMFPTTFEPQVSYLSHAIGLVTGMMAGLVLTRFIPVRDPS